MGCGVKRYFRLLAVSERRTSTKLIGTQMTMAGNNAHSGGITCVNAATSTVCSTKFTIWLAAKEATLYMVGRVRNVKMLDMKKLHAMLMT